MKLMRKQIPWLLIYLRLFLTIPAIVLGYYRLTGLPYILLMAVAATSDVYDGKLARRRGAETASLRQWDSIADTIFFLGVLVGIKLSFPAVYTTYKFGIFAVIALEILRYSIDWVKFRRGASYHAISAKIFGVTLLVSTLATMGFGVTSPFWEIALAMGIISELEGLCMSFVLRTWTYNVKHIGVAIKIMRNGPDNKNSVE